MNSLVEDGLGLMVLGMGFVFLFLFILILVTNAMSSLLNKYFPEADVVPSKDTKTVSPAVVTDAKLTAIITAAIHQHRANTR